MTLGQSLADAVATCLSGRGMSKSQALSSSRGAMDASGSEAGWQQDRRVDVLLGNTEGARPPSSAHRRIGAAASPPKRRRMIRRLLSICG